MNFKKLVILIIAIIAVLLGSLWFLQGTGTLNVCPVLCFADCKCIKGGSPFWEIVGLVLFSIGTIGITLVYKDRNKKQ